MQSPCLASAPTRPPLGSPRPRPAPTEEVPLFSAFGHVDVRLRREVPHDTPWRPLVAALSDTTPEEQRFAAYRALREARVYPDDFFLFLFAHAANRSLLKDFNDLDRHVAATLRGNGLDYAANLYEQNRLEFDRAYERGRQYFHGPPDEGYAEHLRKKGIID